MKFAVLVSVLACGCMNPAPPIPAGLRVEMVLQQRPEWCWLAVAEMMGAAATGADVPQCAMAGADCCDDDVANIPACNQTGLVVDALRNSYGLKAEMVPFDVDELRSELRAGRPVGVDYFLASGSGHSVLITDYDQYLGYNKIDPGIGESRVEDVADAPGHLASGENFHAARLNVLR